VNRLNTLYKDAEGQEWVATGASVAALAEELPEDFTGHLTVRDEAGFVRGWIRSRLDWRAA